MGSTQLEALLCLGFGYPDILTLCVQGGRLPGQSYTQGPGNLTGVHMEQSPGLFEFLNLRFHPRYEMGVTGMLLLTGLQFSVPGWMCTRTPFAHKAQRLVEMAESCKSLPVLSSSPQTLSLTRLSSKGTFSLSDTSESSVAKVNGEEKHTRGVCAEPRRVGGWVGDLSTLLLHGAPAEPFYSLKK